MKEIYKSNIKMKFKVSANSQEEAEKTINTIYAAFKETVKKFKNVEHIPNRLKLVSLEYN